MSEQQQKKWYAVHIYSGFEEKVAEEIMDTAKRKGLESCIEEIFVPKEKVQKSVRGKRVMVQRSSLPGYILIHADLTDHLHNLIKNTNRVTDFLIADGRPVVIKQREVDNIKKHSQGSLEQVETDSFEVGENVKINEGAFAGFNGTIKEVLEEDQKFKIEVAIFGRPVVIDLTKDNIEKAREE